MADKLWVTLICALAILGFLIAINEAMDVPLVSISNTTGKCVYVEIDGKKCDCTILDSLDRYQTQYVQ